MRTPEQMDETLTDIVEKQIVNEKFITRCFSDLKVDVADVKTEVTKVLAALDAEVEIRRAREREVDDVFVLMAARFDRLEEKLDRLLGEGGSE